jgi:hypothetical protein
MVNEHPVKVTTAHRAVAISKERIFQILLNFGSVPEGTIQCLLKSLELGTPSKPHLALQENLPETNGFIQAFF